MSLSKINPKKTEAWKMLIKKREEIAGIQIIDLFDSSKNRIENFSIEFDNMFLDFSKNIIDDETFELLIKLCEDCELKKNIKSLFIGDKINETDNRSVLHTALRDFNLNSEFGQELLSDRQKIEKFTNDILSGKTRGSTNKKITDIVNVGIGGSDLGPNMVVESLKFYKTDLNCHFVSNVDGDHLQEVLKLVDPETTVFIIVSKTFTTQETLTNAKKIKEFLVSRSIEDISNHFIGVTSNVKSAVEFGLDKKNIFKMYDFVGGRFSVWGSVGLSVSLAVGYENFEKFLRGANKMDEHFKISNFEKNIPVCLALISIWYNNFMNCETEAVLPYSEYLKYLPHYLQQMFMESNGKCIDRFSDKVDYQTGTIVWGGTGTNSQHAFFQLLHQGTKLIPCDFIGFKTSLHGNDDAHNKLMSNFIAQTQALMVGGSMGDNPFRKFEGNHPSNTILFDKVNPESLGMILSMYEHKVFVQGIILNIFSFDQWGVELGKSLATKLLTEIESKNVLNHDPSTKNLLDKLIDK